MRQQNAKKNLNRIVGTMKPLLELGMRKRKDNIIKDIENLFRLKKNIYIYNSLTKDIRNRFRLKKENETIKNKIIRDI